MGCNGLFSDDSDFNQIRDHVTWVATDCSRMILILIKLFFDRMFSDPH